MKLLAILLLLVVAFIMFSAGIMYIFMFAMSFDAPGSASDPKAWFMRIAALLPIAICLVVIIFGFIAIKNGAYGRSVLYSSSVILVAGVLWTMLTLSSQRSLKEYQDKRALEMEWEKQYPRQTFMREKEGGADTIIVWPNKIVAWRIVIPDSRGLGGPLGDLNDTRDTLIYNEHFDNRVPRSELEQFVDERGRKFTDVYQVR